MQFRRLIVLCILLLQSGLIAQEEGPVLRKAAKILHSLAMHAQERGLGPRAKEALSEILQHYEPEHRAARRALGYAQQADGSWKLQGKKMQWLDKASAEARSSFLKARSKAYAKLASLHRKLGLELWQQQPELGKKHLLRVLRFAPMDRQAHLQLGHKEGGGFFGTPAQVAFVRRMRELEQEAAKLAATDYDLQSVPELPAELAVLNLPMHGVRSQDFLVYARGPKRNAEECAAWARRALAFLSFSLGETQPPPQSMGYTAFVWTEAEMQLCWQANRDKPLNADLHGVLADLEPDQLQSFLNLRWQEGSKVNEIATHLMPAAMHDRMVTAVWEQSIGLDAGCNDALVEGALHAATWYLLSTAINKRGDLPKGTAASREVPLPQQVGWWLRSIRDQALAGTDMPISQAVRKPLARFPNQARLKLWSFMTWLMARYPDRWHAFLLAVPGDKVPFPAEVEAAARQVFDRDLLAVEAEWREWAAGRSVTAVVTGYAPPQLATSVSAQVRDGLTRLNELRAAAGLQPCELDAEASLACLDHALFLDRWPEHHSWPQVHQQDPAREGFSARGMRAALNSVIVVRAKGVERSVDEWFGTVYHRFPLLAQDIRRIGLAYEKGMCVLDMNSLQEPQPKAELDWVRWPADGATDVRRGFAWPEFPNPLADQPPPHNRDRDAGYPVSLQLSPRQADQLRDASIQLDMVTSQGLESVPIHVHRPGQPLLAKMEDRRVVFAIPQSKLKKRQQYRVLVVLDLLAGKKEVVWSFTTGSKAR